MRSADKWLRGIEVIRSVTLLHIEQVFFLVHRQSMKGADEPLLVFMLDQQTVLSVFNAPNKLPSLLTYHQSLAA